MATTAKKKTAPASRGNPKRSGKAPTAKGHFQPAWHETASDEALLLSHMAYATDEKRLEGYLRASALVPDGSPLNDVLDAFFEHTPVGLELPLFSFIYYVSAWLTQEDVGIMVGGKKIPPALWIVLLARSGGFKSFSSDIIKRNAPVQSNLDGFESEAKMIDLMADNRREEDDNGNPLIPQRHRWVCDEFAQTLKKIETEGGPLAGCKKYLLLAYDRAPISRKLKSYTQTVDDTTLSFLGINVYDSFLETMSPESLLDGFAQRFAYVIASEPLNENPPRDPKSSVYMEINTMHLEAVTAVAWSQIKQQQLLPEYELNDEARKLFAEWSDVFAKTYDIPASFFIRLRFRLFTFALIYHILAGKGATKEIDKTSARYAALLFGALLGHTKRMLLDIGEGDLAKKLTRVLALKEKHGDEMTIRDVVMGMSGYKVTASEARALWQIAFGSPPPKPKK